MKTIACLAAVALAASAGLGCQSSDRRKSPAAEPPAAPPPPPAAAPPSTAAAPAQPSADAPALSGYAGDIQKLCDVVQLSGVASNPAEDRRLPIANWLAANLTTGESRQFLARIQPLVGNEKAEALEAEARRVGLAGCALAAEWRTQSP